MALRSVETEIFRSWLQRDISFTRGPDGSETAPPRWTATVSADGSQQYNRILERMRTEMAEEYEDGVPVAWFMKVIVLRIVEQMSCMPEISHYDINICHFGAMERTVRRHPTGLPPDRPSELSPIDSALFAHLSQPLPEPEPFNQFMWDHQKKVHVFRAPVKNKIAGSERYASSPNEIESTTRLGHFNEAIRTSARPLGVFQAVSRFYQQCDNTPPLDDYRIKAGLAFVHYLLAGLEVLDAANASRTDNLASEIVEYLAAMVQLVRKEGDSEDNKIFDKLVDLLEDRKRPHAHVTGRFHDESIWRGSQFQNLWVGRSAYSERQHQGNSVAQQSQMYGLFDDYIPPGRNVNHVLAPNDEDFHVCWRTGSGQAGSITEGKDFSPLEIVQTMEGLNYEYNNRNVLDVGSHERRPHGDRIEAFKTIKPSLQAIEDGVIEPQDCRDVAVAYLCMCYDGYISSRPYLAECGEVQYTIDAFEEAEENMANAPRCVQNWIRNVIGLLKLLCQMRVVLLDARRRQLPAAYVTQGADLSGVVDYTGNDIRKGYLSISKPSGRALYLPEPRRSEEFVYGGTKYKLSLKSRGKLSVIESYRSQHFQERGKDLLAGARPTEVEVEAQLPKIFKVSATWKAEAKAQASEDWTRIANRILSGKYGHEATLWFISLVSVSGDISLSERSTNCCYMRSGEHGVKGRVDEPMSRDCASSLAYIYCTSRDKLYWTDQQRRPELYEVTFDEGRGSFHFQHVARVEGNLDSYVRVSCVFRRWVGSTPSG